MKRQVQRLHQSLERILGAQCPDESLLERALTHTSYANAVALDGKSNPPRDNERLEFLGDTVLNLVVADELFHRFPEASEGRLSRMRAYCVCERSLFRAAGKLGLGQYVLVGKGEEKSGGRKRPSLLSDTFEAVVGAVYLASGLEATRRFVRATLGEIIDRAHEQRLDPKGQLLAWAQEKHGVKPEYNVIKEWGPDHDKRFLVAVSVNGVRLGVGEGPSKKVASARAAMTALEGEAGASE